jgi:hypothetical protein
MSKNSAKQNLECFKGWLNSLTFQRSKNPKSRKK